MKRLLVILFLLLPAAAFGYRDYRGVNLDSLERIVAKWPWSRVEKASREEVNEYAVCVDELSRGYSTIDPARSQYYARIFLNLDTVSIAGTVFIRGRFAWEIISAHRNNMTVLQSITARQ